MQLVFIDSNGTADVDGKRYRFSLGNQFQPGSIYSNDPIDAPWSAREIKKQPPLISGMFDEEFKSNALCNFKKSLDSVEDIGSHILIPSIHRKVFNSKYRFIGLAGGRGSGKSYSIADSILLRGITDKIRVLCGRQVQRSLEESVLPLLHSRIDELGIGNLYEITNNRILGTNGTSITFTGFNSPESIKSAADINILWVEESSALLPVALETLIPTIRLPGSQLIFSFNRLSEDIPVDKLFYANKPENALLLESSYSDNPFLSDSLYNDIKRMKENDYILYDHIYGGSPQNDPRRSIIRNWRIENLDDLINNNDKLVPILGLDLGFSDPTAFIEAFVLPDKKIYVSDERVKTHLPNSDIPAMIFGDDPRDNPKWSNMDERGNKKYTGIGGYLLDYWIIADSEDARTIHELKNEYDLKIKPAIKGPGSVRKGLRNLQDHEIIVNPSCTNFIYECKNYQYKIDPKTDKVINDPDPNTPHHGIDALRYAFESIDRNLKPDRRY